MKIVIWTYFFLIKKNTVKQFFKYFGIKNSKNALESYRDEHY